MEIEKKLKELGFQVRHHPRRWQLYRECTGRHILFVGGNTGTSTEKESTR